MELSSSEMKTIQHQYDALAKKVLKGEARSYYRELSKRAALEVNFSEMSEAELSQLYTLDEYESDYYRFEVSGYDVLVKNELLGEALQALPEKKRDIILLSYFLDMSDEEIGGLLNVVRSTKSLTIYSIQKAATAGGALCGGDGAIHVLPCYTAFYRQPAAEHDRGLSKNYYCYRHMIRLP